MSASAICVVLEPPTVLDGTFCRAGEEIVRWRI